MYLRCGATLVTRGPEVAIVVTAAHCASLPLSGLSIICGGHNLVIDPVTGTQTFKDGYKLDIISIKTHEEYETRTYINDIALIFAEVKCARNNPLYLLFF